jgi:hypothetical protein
MRLQAGAVIARRGQLLQPLQVVRLAFTALFAVAQQYASAAQRVLRIAVANNYPIVFRQPQRLAEHQFSHIVRELR